MCCLFGKWKFNRAVSPQPHLCGLSTIGQDFPGSPVVKTSPSKAGGVCLITAWEAKIPHALWPKIQNIKQKQYRNKFNKEFKYGLHKKYFKRGEKNQQYGPKISSYEMPFSLLTYISGFLKQA